MSTELELSSQRAVAIPQEGESLLRMAIENRMDVGAIERLVALRDRERAMVAKQAYDDALSAFQAECPIILKTRSNGKGRYAPLDVIVFKTKELLQRHGFSFSLTTETESGWVKAVCKITHSRGHSEPTEAKFPIDDNDRNAMSTPQRYATAMTYAKRYAFCNGFGILTSEEDMDGESKEKPKGPSNVQGEASTRELAIELWNLLKPIAGADKTWQSRNQFLWDETILHDNETCPNLTPQRFREVIEKVKTKLQPPR